MANGGPESYEDIVGREALLFGFCRLPADESDVSIGSDTESPLKESENFTPESQEEYSEKSKSSSSEGYQPRPSAKKSKRINGSKKTKTPKKTKIEAEKDELAKKVEELSSSNADLTKRLTELISSHPAQALEEAQAAKSELAVRCLGLEMKESESQKIIDAFVRANVGEAQNLQAENERLKSRNACLTEQNTDLLNRLSSYLTSKEAAEVVLQTEKDLLKRQYQAALFDYNQLREASTIKAQKSEELQQAQQDQIADLKRKIDNLNYELDKCDGIIRERDCEVFDLRDKLQYLEPGYYYPSYPEREEVNTGSYSRVEQYRKYSP